MKAKLSALVAAFIVMGASVNAEAACSTAALAGKWKIKLETGNWCKITISKTGNYTVQSGPCLAEKLSLSKSCKLSGAVLFDDDPYEGDHVRYTIYGATESIPKNTTAKPNLMIFDMYKAGENDIYVTGHRYYPPLQ